MWWNLSDDGMHTPTQLDRATLATRRAAVHAELLELMRTVERCRGALALLDELLALPDPPPPRGLEAVA
jgi:hypothetical protein